MSDRKRNTVLISLAASMALAAVKLIAGLMIGSLALMTDALHSTTDFLASLCTYFAVRVAAKPADDIHTYGHGKFENLAALGETALLLLLAGGVAVEAISRLGSGQYVPATPGIVYGILAVEIAVNSWRAWSMRRIAVETSSPALASNALHFATDVASSIAVVIGLIAASRGVADADAIAALVVAAIIAILALRLAKSTIDQLVDAAPAGLVNAITDRINSVPGALHVHEVRMRRVGPTDFVEATIDVARTLSTERLGNVVADIRAAILAIAPNANTQVETRPVTLDDETILERIHLAANRARLPIHHVTLQALGDNLAIALDLEVDGHMPLAAAHDEALRLERALQDEFGATTEVEIHIEPARAEAVGGHDVAESEREKIEADLIRLAATTGAISDIHRVRARRLEDDLFVVFHCHLDGTMLIDEVHARLDGLEQALRAEWPAIKRIVSHPDPL